MEYRKSLTCESKLSKRMEGVWRRKILCGKVVRPGIEYKPGLVIGMAFIYNASAL
jgi:hypothetical protein